LIRGKVLKKGDTIGLIAPASPVSKEKVDLSKTVLEQLGFKVKIGTSCYEEYGYLAGKDEVRAKDLNMMFSDDGVHGIICIRGGYGTLKILNMLDYEMIKNSPKIFVGYSDITNIHIALNQICGLITIHGPMAASNMIEDFDDFSKESLLRTIGNNEPIGQLSNPVREDMKVFNRGVTEGEIVGGNLALVAASMGTPYEIDTKDKIFFLEDIDERPYSIDRMLTELLLARKLQEAKGIILGDFKNCEPDNDEDSLSLMQVFEDIILPLNKPTIYNVKSGHCHPMLTLPLGARAQLDADNGKITILEGAVV
jgi:muramoyltetrapeptide carboxypeptidase